MKRGIVATGALALSLMITACGAPSTTGTAGTTTAGTSATAATGAGESATSMPAMEPTTSTGGAGESATRMPAMEPTTSTDTTGTTGAGISPTSAAGTTGTTSAGTSATSVTGAEGAVAALIADPRFSTLTMLLSSTGLDQQLEAVGPVTIFAPTDEAFAALPEGTLAALSQDPTTLAQILRYHVAEGAYRKADITQEASVPTLEGEEVTLSISGSTIRVNDTAEIVGPDISAGSSVVHAIDEVLIPHDNSAWPAAQHRRRERRLHGAVRPDRAAAPRRLHRPHPCSPGQHRQVAHSLEQHYRPNAAQENDTQQPARGFPGRLFLLSLHALICLRPARDKRNPLRSAKGAVLTRRARCSV